MSLALDFHIAFESITSNLELLSFQGQLLTLVEYLMLLYRAILPTPVWYRFFLNKEYGSLFSSLMTGLYLTFKLTSVVEKVKQWLIMCVSLLSLYCSACSPLRIYMNA